MTARRTTTTTKTLAIALGLLALLAAGCGDDEAHDEAVSLYEALGVSQRTYQSWSSPRGFDTRHPSVTLHGGDVRIYYNDVAAPHVADCQAFYDANKDSTDPTLSALLDQSYFAIPTTPAASEWPTGTTFVKEGFDGAELVIVAIMEKRDDGEWFFAEYDGDGEVLFSGRPEVCLDCHGGAMDDHVFTAHLTRLCRNAELVP